jgi:hypothetical protein
LEIPKNLEIHQRRRKFLGLEAGKIRRRKFLELETWPVREGEKLWGLEMGKLELDEPRRKKTLGIRSG